ncbi:site-2 protease family protein [Clostridium aminobutyricum]|uniref:Site-2 protease family protein n=1 Tax=Clostridium aminobutyricum TaxID=33953 RepID=A0A939D6F0_CLOAM|nr:site-2 protease family protein [Clostridium aminobutyricum]MBN7771937.1 site-2 protease family protein [Clostridium aminobutyricum]
MKRLYNPTFLVLIVVMAAMAFLNGRFANPLDWLMNMALMLPAIVIGLSFHEFGHAFAAYKLGDMTPKYQGRVTLNPLSHIDPFGFLCLMVAGFGWGVPVQVNPDNFKKPRRDELIVSVAGVAVNFLIALVSAGILALFFKFNYTFIAMTYMGGIVQQIISYLILINLVLMIFNLLPIPPLDGFGIITELFNLRNTSFYYQIYDKGFLILMVLILLNVTEKILSPTVNFFYTFLLGLFF